MFKTFYLDEAAQRLVNRSRLHIAESSLLSFRFVCSFLFLMIK